MERIVQTTVEESYPIIVKSSDDHCWMEREQADRFGPIKRSCGVVH
jgi:hypothetical protein